MKMKYGCVLMLAASLMLLGGCGMVMQPAGEEGFYRMGVQTASQNMSAAAEGLSPSVSASYNGIAKAVVTIVNARGMLVINSDILQLFNMNGTYLSESTRIAVGTYRVTRYLVADSSNNVLFAAPLEGSPLASQVSQPLPLSFRVTANSVIDVVPEILPVAGHTAADFGYEGTEFPDPAVMAYPSKSIVKYYSLGDDGAAFSDDDYCYGYVVQDYISFYTNKDAKNYNTVDGIMGNGDDTINGWWDTELTADKGSWKTSGPGPDNAWFTDDDIIVRTEDWSGTVRSGVLYQPICTDAGPDLVWFTSDDVQTAYYLDTLNASGNVQQRAYYAGTGTNGVLAEDWFGAYYVNTYDSGDYNRWWSWIRQDRYNVDGTQREYIIHEFSDPRFPRFFTREIYYNPQGQVTYYAIAENIE